MKLVEMYKDKMVDKVDELFPKLNADDTSKPSWNNRGAAIVLCAEACILIEELCDKIERLQKEKK